MSLELAQNLSDLKILLSSLALLVALAALVWAIVSGAFTAPAEFGLLYNWQTLIAGCLALVGAAGVLVAARMQVMVADREVQQRRRAARMLLASQTEDLATSCNNIIWDLDLWRETAGEMGARHFGVPLPPFARDFPELGIVPPRESENLMMLVRLIRKTNELAAAKKTHEGFDQAEKVIRPVAAEVALRAVERNEYFSRIVGWEPMKFDRGRLRKLMSIVDEDRKKHEVIG